MCWFPFAFAEIQRLKSVQLLDSVNQSSFLVGARDVADKRFGVRFVESEHKVIGDG